jgi:lipopolysaccharide/colanic/teichoic acid biosynthesis glycosyltransferase
MAAAAFGLLALAPLLAAIGALVAVTIGRPIFFHQERPGLGGKSFSLLKFRTMTDERDQQGELLPDEERLPRFGRILRSTSLDELPELWNVLRGDMSLVGPRPLLPEYLELYTPEQFRRHEVKPGMTGLAQVSGRNALNWEERFELDVQYVDELSLSLDLRIFVRTASIVLKRRGISADNHSTMPRFQGSEGVQAHFAPKTPQNEPDPGNSETASSRAA